MKEKITIQTSVNAPIEKIWQYWNEPTHMTHWNFASNDWCCPKASVDLKVGGKFAARMESKDGTQGFDFEGVYTKIEDNKKIEYVIADSRTVAIEFIPQEIGYNIVETFEAETMNPIEMQRGGWQAILDNFKKYAENN